MSQIAAAMALAQLAIAALHFAWAARIWWPIREEAALTRAVVGVKGMEKMPDPVACGLVGVALTFAAFWPWLPEGCLRSLGLAAIAFVYLARGLVGFTPFMARVAPEEPFRTLNRRYYNLICIALGLGAAMLFLGGA